MRKGVAGAAVALPLAPMLPAILQEDAAPGRLLGELLGRLDGVLAPAIETLDSLHAYLDPEVAPADFLAWVAEWLGVADLVAMVPLVTPARSDELLAHQRAQVWLPRQRAVVAFASRLVGGPRLVPAPGHGGELFRIDDAAAPASLGTIDALHRLLAIVVGAQRCTVEVSTTRPHVAVRTVARPEENLTALEELVRRVGRYLVPAHVAVEVVVAPARPEEAA